MSLQTQPQNQNKNYSSILAIINHRNWLDDSPPLMALIDLSWIAEFFTVTCDVEKILYLLFKVFEEFYSGSFRAKKWM